MEPGCAPTHVRKDKTGTLAAFIQNTVLRTRKFPDTTSSHFDQLL
jgi:hypothetical protein